MRAGVRGARAAVLLSSLAAAGCLTASQESRLQTDLEEVRRQVFEIQRSNAEVAAKMEEVRAALAKQETASPTRWADIQALLQSLADEVRRLGARVDDGTARLGMLARDIAATRDQYRALEARIAAMMGAQGAAVGSYAGGAPAGAPPPPAPPAAPIGSAAAGPVPAVGPPQAPAPGTPTAPAGAPGIGAGPSAPAAPPAPQAAAMGVSVPTDEEQEEAFRAAYARFTRGDADAALAGFQQFLERYPLSPLAGSAHYYAGECHFSRQRYQEAAAAFSKAITGDPEGERAAAAYLKKGLSLLALKQTAQGVVQLQHVIEAYPRSEEARIAADRLRQLGLRDR